MRVTRLHLSCLIAAIAVPAGATELNESTYIRCDDGQANPTRIGIALNEKSNTAALTDYYMEVSDISAVSFGPSEVKFTAHFVSGALKIFTVSRIDATVTSYYPLLKSTWTFKGCAVADPPKTRAF